MYNLTLAFTTESLMSLLFKAQTTAWPNGLAHLVVKELFKKFRPRDTISRVELRSQLNAVSMDKKDNPSTLFEQKARSKTNSMWTRKEIGLFWRKRT